MTNPGPQTNHPDIVPGSSDIPGRLDFGSICADWGCNKVHPAENHDTYVARYRHSADCDICAKYEASRKVIAATNLHHFGVLGCPVHDHDVSLNLHDCTCPILR